MGGDPWPFRGHMVRIDPLWASAMAGKDYNFPSDWNASFWLVNLGHLGVRCGVCAADRRGIAARREIGLLAGADALVSVSLISWPLMLAGIALALQLQTSRVFWMLDFLAASILRGSLPKRHARLPSARSSRVAIVAASPAGVRVGLGTRGNPSRESDSAR